MDLTFPWEAPAFAPIFAQRDIELQAVPSIQSLQPPSHEGTLGPSAAELLDVAFPRTTAKRKLDLLEGLPSFQLTRKPAVASLRQSTLRHALVSRLLILLKAAGDSCPILALADEDPWMGWQLVSDVVSGRSESTLKARLGYLERYFAWCSDHRLAWVPLTVSATWKWMQALKDASPSAPTSGYQSLRWFAHMFQCAADADFFSSPLLKGSATHSLQAAPPLRQKPPILVSQVKRLELLTDSDEPALVNIVGGILVALYSRSRWMDLQRASSLELDAPEGITYFGNTFYQLNTSEYKTSKSGGKSRLILPLTLPIFSLSGSQWFQNWLAARDRLGLPVQGAITPPLIRSVGAQGDTPRPFNTSEVNSILAKIAKPGEPVPTSRSLKATCLSWVAKAGVSPPLRKLLGYHVDATELSVNTYSRDLLAPPLRELVRVLSLIASGAFSPDTTRSGYFAFNDPGTQDGNDAAPAVLPQPPSASVSADTTAVTAESALGPTSPQSPRTSDSDSSSLEEVVPESTEEDLGDPDESPAAALAAFKQPFFSVQPPFLLVQHQKLRTIHIAGGDSEERLLCGRTNTDRFLSVGQVVHQPFPKCKQCFHASGKHDEC